MKYHNLTLWGARVEVLAPSGGAARRKLWHTLRATGYKSDKRGRKSYQDFLIAVKTEEARYE